MDTVAKATFAAGCFWGVEAKFRKLPGVLDTQVGYTGGHTQNPTYHQVCDGDTGHAEAVEVTFDPTRITYRELVQAFFKLHNPTTKDRQGPDIGSQYRSAIFTHNSEQEKIAREEMKKAGPNIVTEIGPAKEFYRAEEYHQRYHEKHGGSCGL
jgi:peptide-methionine (S)-S-oxide reductase